MTESWQSRHEVVGGIVKRKLADDSPIRHRQNLRPCRGRPSLSPDGGSRPRNAGTHLAGATWPRYDRPPLARDTKKRGGMRKLLNTR